MSTTAPEAPEAPADAAADTTHPGHPDAVAAGCICPAWINSYGDGLRSVPGAEPAEGQYLRHPDCRLHGSL